MRSRRWLVTAILLVVLALPAGWAQAQGGPEPASALSLDAVVSEAISYQAYLTEGTTPVNNWITLAFQLYSDAACTAQVGTDIDYGSVYVSNGYIDQQLDVNQDWFNGQGLWLKTIVNGLEIGCEEILPTAYALGLRPGAKIVGAPGLTGALVGASTAAGEVKGALVQGLIGAGAGVYGSTSTAAGWGGYFANTGGGQAGYFSGDVAQGRGDDGLVKAAAYVQCSSSASAVTRYFNQISPNVTVVNGAGIGHCTVDFNFSLSDRFWTATSAEGTYARGVSCELGSPNDRLDCFHWNQAGTGFDGPIMIVIY